MKPLPEEVALEIDKRADKEPAINEIRRKPKMSKPLRCVTCWYLRKWRMKKHEEWVASWWPCWTLKAFLVWLLHHLPLSPYLRTETVPWEDAYERSTRAPLTCPVLRWLNPDFQNYPVYLFMYLHLNTVQ